MDGPCSWMKRWWTNRSAVSTPADPVRGTRALKATEQYIDKSIACTVSADEQDHEVQRLAA